MSSDKKNKSDEAQSQTDDASIMNDEELESVSGGCQWGDTMGPKFPGTEPTFPPIIPINPVLD